MFVRQAGVGQFDCNEDVKVRGVAFVLEEEGGGIKII